MPDDRKYRAAVLELGLRRAAVTRLTDSIRQVYLFEGDSESPPHYNCHSQTKSGESCLKRLWEVNKLNYGNRCMAEDAGVGEAETIPLPELCPVCTEAQKLIDERKRAKRELATAKGRVTRLAMAAAKTYLTSIGINNKA